MPLTLIRQVITGREVDGIATPPTRSFAWAAGRAQAAPGLDPKPRHIY